MADEYIVELGKALYDPDTGAAVFKPEFRGELVRCRDCKHYHKNVWGGGDIGIGKPYDNIIVGHHGCDRWGKGNSKDMAYTSPDGFCFLGEREE